MTNRFLFFLSLAVGLGFFHQKTLADEPVVLFADDFSVHGVNGYPDSNKWNAPTGQNPPERMITVVETVHFGVPEEKALRLFKNEQTISSVNTAATSVNRFSHGAEVVTVALDFWENPEITGGTAVLRVGAGTVSNTVRVHEIQWNMGILSGVQGAYTPGVPVRLRAVMNNSAFPVTYDEGRATLASDRMDIWINEVRMVRDLSWNRGGLAVGKSLTSLQLAAFGTSRKEILIRDLRVYEGAVAPERDLDQEVFELFLAPDGSDSSDGRTLETPILTIGRAQQILAQVAPLSDMRIWVLPGRYYGQKVSWTYTSPERRIIFEAFDSEAPKPVFDGRSEEGEFLGGTWLRLRFAGGRHTNLEFRNLRFENYQTAISLDGDRNDIFGFNGGNVISGCYFFRIGNVFNPALKYSTAVIRLVNSKDNLIENNDFVEAINVKSGALLHAIYAAHLSDENHIVQNRFIDNSGDPVRIRDFSNGNLIEDNVFIRAGADGYSEWYCDQDTRTDCTKPTPECPSWDNQFRYNLLVSAWGGGAIGTWKLHQGDSTSGCAPPTESSRRVRTVGNQRVVLKPVDLWQHRHFDRSERSDLEVAGDAASPSGDGIGNLAKYYFGQSPWKPTSQLWEMRMFDGRAGITFWENAEATDVKAVLETSSNLRDWNAVPTVRVEGETKGAKRKVELIENTTGGQQPDRNFLRLRVQRK